LSLFLVVFVNKYWLLLSFIICSAWSDFFHFDKYIFIQINCLQITSTCLYDSISKLYCFIIQEWWASDFYYNFQRRVKMIDHIFVNTMNRSWALLKSFISIDGYCSLNFFTSSSRWLEIDFVRMVITTFWCRLWWQICAWRQTHAKFGCLTKPAPLAAQRHLIYVNSQCSSLCLSPLQQAHLQ